MGRPGAGLHGDPLEQRIEHAGQALGIDMRGDLWEVVAVPDIRTQVSALARRLVNAHWTGGEGL